METNEYEASNEDVVISTQCIAKLSIGQEIFALNWGFAGIDYILYPTDCKIMKGVVTDIVIVVNNEGSYVKRYVADFKGHDYIFSDINLNTFIFKSETEFKKHFDRLRKERKQAGLYLPTTHETS